MIIAVATRNGKTVTQHFGRAAHYLVVTVEDGEVTATELRDKAGHRTFAGEPHDESGDHGFGPVADEKHRQMAASVSDCTAVIAGGMGRGAFVGLQSLGLEAVVTDLDDAVEAAVRYAAGDLPNLMDRLH
jgi:predicted Fe-Mo cluster-binding NifX family protein